MDQAKLSKLENIIENGYDFRMGHYISEGYNLFKKDIGSFLGFTVVFLVIAMMVNAIPMVGSLAFSLLLSPSLVVGYYLFANRLDRGERAEFGQFFSGFDHFAPLTLSALVSMVAMLFCMSPFLGTWWSIMSGNIASLEDFNMSFWMFLCAIPIIYISVAWIWSNMFIIFYDMPFWDAMEMSRKMITKNWPIVFVFLIVVGILVSLGIIAFCIGLLFTVPIGYCALYVAFADVTGLMEEDEEMGIEDHLVI